MPSDVLTVVFIGDVIGKPGREGAIRYLKGVSADFKIINGENLAGGLGITPNLAEEMLAAGVDGITTGNHVWRKKEIIPYLMGEPRVIRPLNYPDGAPGFGYTLLTKNNRQLYVANIEGRTFMNPLVCPFRSMEEFVSLKKEGHPGNRGFSRRGNLGKDCHGMVPRRESDLSRGDAHPRADSR